MYLHNDEPVTRESADWAFVMLQKPLKEHFDPDMLKGTIEEQEDNNNNDIQLYGKHWVLMGGPFIRFTAGSKEACLPDTLIPISPCGCRGIQMQCKCS